MMLRRQALEASDEACRQELERACQDRPALRQAGGGEAAAIKGTMRLRPALFDRRTHRRCRWIGPMETGAAPRPLSAQPVRPGLPMQSPSLGAPSDCADRSSLSKAVDTRRHDPGTTLPSYTSPAFPGVFERTWQVPAGRGVSRHFKCGIPRRPVDLRSLVRSRTCPSALRKPPRRLCPGSNLGSVAECT